MSQFQSTGSWWWPFSYTLPWPLLYMYEGGGQRSLVSNIVRTLILWGQNPLLYHHLTPIVPLEATAVERHPGGYSFHAWGLWEHKTGPTVFQLLTTSSRVRDPKETPCVFSGHCIPAPQVQVATDAEHGLCRILLCQVQGIWSKHDHPPEEAC